MKGYMCNVKPGGVSGDRAEGGQDNACYGIGLRFVPFGLGVCEWVGIKFEGAIWLWGSLVDRRQV